MRAPSGRATRRALVVLAIVGGAACDHPATRTPQSPAPVPVVALPALATSAAAPRVTEEPTEPSTPDAKRARGPAACDEVRPDQVNLVDVYCREVGDGCCIPGGWNCNNAAYVDWFAATCQRRGDAPRASTPPAASAFGKYAGLIKVIEVPEDRATYGTFDDYGVWGPGVWAGAMQPRGYWVYVYPSWYVWQTQR